MLWWQYVLVAFGAVTTIQAARSDLWKGLHAIMKFGDALPEIAKFPETVERLRREVIATRTDLREHMDVEDITNLGVEKALVGVIGRQEKLDINMGRIGHELNNVRQIVMNTVETGSGDRWRLAAHVDAELIKEAGKP